MSEPCEPYPDPTWYYADVFIRLKFIKETVSEMILAIGDRENHSPELDAGLLLRTERINQTISTINSILSTTDDQILEESTKVFRVKDGDGSVLFELDDCKKTDRKVWLERIQILRDGSIDYTEDYQAVTPHELLEFYEELSKKELLEITKPCSCVTTNQAVSTETVTDNLTTQIVHGQWIKTKDGYFRVADISALVTPDITINEVKDNSCYLVMRSGRQYWISEEVKNLLLSLMGV